jgi:rhodanese-related sulfurtransferase
MKRGIAEGLLLLVLAVVPSLLAWSQRPVAVTESDPFEITMEDSRLKKSEIVWVDARSSDFYKEGHAAGAIPLTDEDWDKQIGGIFEAWEPGKTLVAYCDEGCHSSAQVAERLREIGMEPVFFLKGGYNAWKKANSSGR